MPRFTFEAVYIPGSNAHFEIVMTDTTTSEPAWSADLPVNLPAQYGTDDPHIMSDPPTDQDLTVSLSFRGWTVVGEWEDEVGGVKSADVRPTANAYPQITLSALAFAKL